jgi:hypothetical protein
MAVPADQLTAITRKYYLPRLVDQIFNSNALFSRMQKRSIPLDGGTQITLPLVYATTGSVFAYTGYDTFSVTPSEEITHALFDWGQYGVTINLSGREDAINSGKSAVVNLLKAKMQVAEKSLRQRMGDDLWSDGTGQAVNGLTGLEAAIDDGTNTATYGSIARGANTWWKAKYSANGAVGRALTLRLMQNMFGDLTIDNDRPTLLMGQQDVYDKYYLILQPAQRFSSTELAEGGFMNLLFNGRPFVVDHRIPQVNSLDQLYFLNEDYLHLYHHKDRNFFLDPFRRSINQDAIVAKILWMGQFVCDQPRQQGRIIDIDSSL